jgi:antitoxin (DNA-binding transcriptional repressor) of toxin-antitoxin stability system
MKFVTVRDLRGRPTKVWKDLKTERELVLTSNGKPIALLTSVNESSFEESLATLRRARLGQTVRDIQRESRRRFPGGISLKKVNAEIAAARRARKNRGR